MADERRLTVPGTFESLAQISDFIVQVARDSLDIQYVQIFETRTGR